MDEVDLSDRPTTDDKYITFKREDFEKFIYGHQAPRYASYEIPDAVVIRRQDFFAAPALAGYAAGIAIAVRLNDDPLVRTELQKVADYFERQAQLAAEEGFKFPTID